MDPDGTGAFRLVNVTVRAVLSSTGLVVDDPVLGAAVSGQADRTSAKIVDLDTQYQLASAIFGLDLTLASEGKPFSRGRFRSTPFATSSSADRLRAALEAFRPNSPRSSKR